MDAVSWFLGGLGLVCIGCWLIYPPVAYIIAGIVFMCIGFVLYIEREGPLNYGTDFREHRKHPVE